MGHQSMWMKTRRRENGKKADGKIGYLIPQSGFPATLLPNPCVELSKNSKSKGSKAITRERTARLIPAYLLKLQESHVRAQQSLMRVP